MIKDRYNKFEEDYLTQTQNAISENINEELESLKRKKELILEERRYLGDYNYELKDDEIYNLMKVEHVDTNAYVYSLRRLEKLGKLMKEPYFGRFDFATIDEDEDEDDVPEAEDADNFYLGITTLRDPETGRILIYDWRTPIASLYYESNPGDACYESPSGTVRGVLFGKRRYSFKNGKLLSMCNIDMPSDDEFLNQALASGSDSHMKTIVNTIQTKQYKIMRDYIDGVSILQGCAGSGKSSIALHKIAYLMYQFRNKLDSKKIMIVSPNGIFTEYISTVLPELGEENVDSILPEDIVNEIVKRYDNYSYFSREQAIEANIPSIAFKSTLEFRNIINKYIKYLMKNIFTAGDLYIESGDKEIKVAKEEIHDLFYSVYADVPLMDRTMKVSEYICKKYHIPFGERSQLIFLELQYMMKSLSVPALYKMMYTDDTFIKTCKCAIFDSMIGENNLWEDACALALMTLAMCNTEDLFKDIFYIIADEAQDLVPIFIDVLKTLYSGANYLFVGDKNQLVFNGTGNFAEDIKSIILKRPLRLYDLDTNYRSTIEISDYSKKYLPEGSLVHSIRHGDNVVEEQGINSKDLESKIINYISEMEEAGYNHVALLCDTLYEARRIKSLIKLPLRLENKINFEALPVYLAKGLEYDGVITYNVSEKFMYTACTRAMHKLVVLKDCSI